MAAARDEVDAAAASFFASVAGWLAGCVLGVVAVLVPRRVRVNI
jgi:hypothetical protein